MAHVRQQIEIIRNPKSWYLRESNKNINPICFLFSAIFCVGSWSPAEATNHILLNIVADFCSRQAQASSFLWACSIEAAQAEKAARMKKVAEVQRAAEAQIAAAAGAVSLTAFQIDWDGAKMEAAHDMWFGRCWRQPFPVNMQEALVTVAASSVWLEHFVCAFESHDDVAGPPKWVLCRSLYSDWETILFLKRSLKWRSCAIAPPEYCARNAGAPATSAMPVDQSCLVRPRNLKKVSEWMLYIVII